ncbi:MAG: RagB/SusD family nutrient uptake outer membrane protein [Dysgonamonadaceae bacterium]|jgi:hypothetical protein|nr:RagB/SusD family nutrient uptake outer membrane protein [Dysgonamonadaceae bacterium]
MKKIYFILTILLFGFTACEDFLDRPDKANFMLSNFYETDEQCLQAANVMYSLPWNDFFRGWLGVGDKQSGNYFTADDGFWLLTPNNDMDAVQSMSASLWAVNARANTIVENINLYAGDGTTEAVRNQVKGEALAMKALAYFFMVRIYGAVPIVHNNSELLASGEYSSLYRAKIENVYDYIIMTLKQAIEWLPESSEQAGRIDKYCAMGLLAKVYLTKSGYGRSGDRNQADLDEAKKYAGMVVNESGKVLTPEYSDIFRGSHNTDPESLIAWRWVATADNFWTASNYLQADLVPSGFSEGSGWGNWTGPSIDLQEAFGEVFDGKTPSGALSPTRNNTDKRRKATMMMYGDVYEYFLRDHPTKTDVDGNPVTFPDGFDFTKFYEKVFGSYTSPTGANCVKQIVGDNADHTAEFGVPFGGGGGYASSLATHILRLGDVYLVYAEAILGNSATTSDSEALKAFNAVHNRAGLPSVSSLTWQDIFKERRLELAFEGDFWYDLVRWHYYQPDAALAYLNGQNRKNFVGLDDYYKNKGWESWGQANGYPKDNSPRINAEQPDGKPFTHDKFTMPFPSTDLQMNPHLKEDPIDYDISQYHYE